jgi:hypothetical protein
MWLMEKIKRVFKSFDEAEKANREFYNSLSGTERLDILLTLISQNKSSKHDEVGSGPKRIYRVIKRS